MSAGFAIESHALGKRYRSFANRRGKILSAFGLERFARRQGSRDFWAVRDITLTIKAGERVGLVGANGAGKSTLLKMICGNVYPTQGQLKVQGRIDALMEMGVGFHPDMSGRANVLSALAYQGIVGDQAQDLTEEVIEFSELEDFIEEPVKNYSAGMYARLAFSAATVRKPEILIIDEILGAGDEYFAGKSIERMKSLTNDEGVTVLFVSHDLASVQSLCDRAIWIDGGKLVMDSDPLTVVKEYRDYVNVRKEQRLLARDAKISRRDMARHEQDSDLFRHLLFRFVPLESDAFDLQSINSIALFDGADSIVELNVGDARDNDREANAYVIDSFKETNWSEAKGDSSGYYRQLDSASTRYNHAPFELRLPNTHDLGSVTIQVECLEAEQAVQLQMFNGVGYEDIGPVGVGTTKFSLAADTAVEVVDPAPVVDRKKFEYGSRELEILSVELSGRTGSARVFTIWEPFDVVVEYTNTATVDAPVIAFCVYAADGTCAFQWLMDMSNQDLDVDSPTQRIRFHVDQLQVGRGAYVASVAAFKTMPNGIVEPEALHCLDRAVHFQVVQPVETTYDLGLCVQTPQLSVDRDG